jgi:hypothetical protein
MDALLKETETELSLLVARERVKELAKTYGFDERCFSDSLLLEFNECLKRQLEEAARSALIDANDNSKNTLSMECVGRVKKRARAFLWVNAQDDDDEEEKTK